MTQPRHVMRLDSDPGSSEIWVCDTCLRRVLIQWQPWEMTVLYDGDLDAIHSGGKGGMQIGVEVAQDEPLPPEFEDWWSNLTR